MLDIHEVYKFYREEVRKFYKNWIDYTDFEESYCKASAEVDAVFSTAFKFNLDDYEVLKIISQIEG